MFRERAIKRLKKRRALSGNLLVDVLVNAVPSCDQGDDGSRRLLLAGLPDRGLWHRNAWDVYRSDESDEEQIRREIERLQAHAAGKR